MSSPLPLSELVAWPLNNNVCGDAGPVACPTDEVMTCTSECYTPALAYEECDPLAGFMDPNRCNHVEVCAEREDGTGRWTTSCVRVSSTEWECRPHNDGGRNLFGICDPSDGDHPCPADTRCVDMYECTGENPFYEDVYFCMPYRLQGEKCDSSYAGFASCDKCAPETDCVAAASAGEPYSGYCRKECTTADDCPCSADGSQDHGCENGYCYDCKYEGEECTNGLDTCCSDLYDLECGSGECCRVDGEDCDVDGDCCAESYCEDDTLCSPCTDEFDACTTQEECCGGDCVSGFCRENCTNQNSKKCDTGLEGVCALGTYNCVGGYDLYCVQDTAASQEICDGKDNDCDGVVDENPSGEGVTCGKEPVPGCPTTNPNVWMEFYGSTKCVNGNLVCESIPGTHFCSNCDTQQWPIGDCGACQASCTLDSHCPPNHVCNVGGPTGVCEWEPNCGDLPKCWLPSDKGACPYP